MSIASASPQARRSSLWSIDLLRGLAASLVFLYHANGMFWGSPGYLWDGHLAAFLRDGALASRLVHLALGCGFVGVNLFFVISGFCIHWPAANQARGLDWRVFGIRRFFRLYPLYLTVVAACFLLVGMRAGFGRNPVTWSNLSGHLVFWHYGGGPGDPGMGISPVLWTIAVEVQFYFLYAFTLPVLRRVGLGRCAVLGLACEVIYLWWCGAAPVGASGWLAALQPDRLGVARFGEWLLGAWIAESFGRGSASAQCGRAGSPRAACWAGLLCALSSLAVVGVMGWPRVWLNPPLAVGAGLIVWGLITAEKAGVGAPVASPARRIARWLGERSYSLYLVHFTVLAVGVEVGARLLGVADKSAWRGSPGLLAVIVGSGGLALVVTDLCYRLIEAPTHRWAGRLAARLQQRQRSALSPGCIAGLDQPRDDEARLTERPAGTWLPAAMTASPRPPPLSSSPGKAVIGP